jgi:PiT family inorganic phosphate transporter
MMVAPVAGLLVGFLLMGLLLLFFRHARPMFVNRFFGKAQLVSAAWMSFEHGRNDAQKTMGIIALALFTATKGDVFAGLPGWLHFVKLPTFDIPVWVKVICAITMAAGTAAGGWKIIKTMGQNLVKLQPVHGFAAQTTASAVIGVATHFGIPLSTTHVISGSIMGVGATKRLNAVKWGTVGRMIWAWVLTLPITAAISYCLLRLVQATGQA